MTPLQASEKSNEKEVYSSLRGDREKQSSNYNVAQLVRTANFKRNFSKRGSTNCSYKIYTVTEVIHYTIPSYRINYFSDRYNESLLLPTKLSLEEKNQVVEKLNLIQ